MGIPDHELGPWTTHTGNVLHPPHTPQHTALLRQTQQHLILYSFYFPVSRQSVALASLVRMTYILCKQLNPSLLLSAQQPQPSLTQDASDSINFLRFTLSASTSSPSLSWLPFLQGISQCHPKGTEDGNSTQWSLGIDHVLRCAEYLKNVFPRKMTSSRTDNALFSLHFRICHSGLFLTLSSLLSSKTPSSSSVTAISPLDLVSAATSASKALVSLHE